MITKRPEHAANIINLDCGDGCTIVYLLKNHLIVYLKQVHFKMWEFTSVNIFFFSFCWWMWRNIRRKSLPRLPSHKESACQCRRHKRCGFDPWARKIPWRRKWMPSTVFLPGKSHDKRAWWATVFGVAKNQTQLSDWARRMKFGIICGESYGTICKNLKNSNACFLLSNNSIPRNLSKGNIWIHAVRSVLFFCEIVYNIE